MVISGFYIQTGGVKMQLHWLGFGQTRCSIESVTISASANWFIQGKSQKKILFIKK
jgi:hypothetical protein